MDACAPVRGRRQPRHPQDPHIGQGRARGRARQEGYVAERPGNSSRPHTPNPLTPLYHPHASQNSRASSTGSPKYEGQTVSGHSNQSLKMSRLAGLHTCSVRQTAAPATAVRHPHPAAAIRAKRSASRTSDADGLLSTRTRLSRCAISHLYMLRLHKPLTGLTCWV